MLNKSGIATPQMDSLIIYTMTGKVRQIILFCTMVKGDAMVIFSLEQNKSKKVYSH
jgi:hypothetical protein